MCDQQSLRSDCAYVQPNQRLCLLLENYMIVKLLTEHHLEFLRLKGGCRGSSESTHVKIPHCWKSHALARRYNILSIALIITKRGNSLQLSLTAFTLTTIYCFTGYLCLGISFPMELHLLGPLINAPSSFSRILDWE